MELDEIRQAVRRLWADFAETVIGWHRSPVEYRPPVVGPANTTDSNMAGYQFAPNTLSHATTPSDGSPLRFTLCRTDWLLGSPPRLCR